LADFDEHQHRCALLRVLYGPAFWVGIIFGMAETNDCFSFRILQDYDNLQYRTAQHTVIGQNGTLILTVTLILPYC